MNFEGTYVAMVTPFDKNKEIDEEGFRSNINYLIDQGVNGLVGAGTTVSQQQYLMMITEK